MFVGNVFLVVSLVGFLRGFHVSGCDHNCADKPEFTPSRLVVKYNDPASASCSVCQQACHGNLFGLEKSVGNSTTNNTTISWDVDRMTEWDTSAMCYYNDDNDDQCCSTLNVTVYQPPDDVSISFDNHSGLMFEGHQYSLQCTVQNVAPVENLTVTFYRGQTALGQLQSNNKNKKPVTEIFTFNIIPRKEHDGDQYWCEAKLELGPEGPQLPPVMKSQSITSTVYYEPQLNESSRSRQITIIAGEPLQLDCSAVGNPGPSYTWTLPLTGPSPSNSNILTIQSVAAKDKGQYTCSVSNNVGNITVQYDVDVHVNHIAFIVVGILLVVALLLIVGTIIYCSYYKQNKTGHYNLFQFMSKGASVV